MGQNFGKQSARATIFLSLVVVLNPAVIRISALPPEFEDRLVVTIPGIPLDIAWTSDGRMLVPTKDGQIWVYASGALIPEPALDLSGVICTDGERGIGGVELHPEFSLNHYIYVYYTFNKFGTCAESQVNGPVNRLSRFTLGDDNVIALSSEVVFLDTPPLLQNYHNGGDVKFGNDGYLYATIGDSGTDWSRDPGRLLGKIVRVTGSGLIPPENPFTGPGTARCNVNGVPPPDSPAGAKCQEVYAQGLRNPFRFAFDPNSENLRFFINDVGQNTWEEVDLGQAGADYGWPLREGPCVKDSRTNCGPPPPGVTNPIYWYGHNVTRNGVGCASVTGGAFVPDGVWPLDFAGSYLLADYVCDWIWKLSPDTTGGFVVSDFAEVPVTGLISMRFGPYGTTMALYYVTFGGQLRRIAFTGTLNKTPVANATATPVYGPVPLEVEFNATTSSDPDGDPLTYHWDFGDGSAPSSESAIAHTYSVSGTFVTTLTVTDGRGGTDSTTIRVDAGNMPPIPRIEYPPADSVFAVNDEIILYGSADDPEDGQLTNSSLTWEVVRRHGNHLHPFLSPTQGNGIPITFPAPEDLEAAQTSFLEVKLRAVDSQGLSVTVTQDLRPRFVDIQFYTNPHGLALAVSGLIITGPSLVRSWDHYDLIVNAPNQTDSNGQPWVFRSWSDGGASSHVVTTPPSPVAYTASFSHEPTTLTFIPTDDTYVSSTSPNGNFGSEGSLKVDNSPVEHILLRFSTSGVGTRKVLGAKLLLYAVDPSTSGGDFRRVNDTSWTENNVTWNTAPPSDSDVLFSLGPVSTGTWYEADLTSVVTGDGVLSLRVSSASNDGAHYSSRDGANPPELLVTVVEPNPPFLDLIGDKTVNEGQPLSFTATASDVDGDTLAFNLEPGSPSGAAITSSGVFSWMPSETEGPGSYPITITVSDGTAQDSETIGVTVFEVNRAPTVVAPEQASANEGETLSFIVSATDPDIPANTIALSVENLPPGASFDPSTGNFTWATTPGQSGTHAVSFNTTDDGSPVMFGSSTTTITVILHDVAATVLVVSRNFSYDGVGSDPIVVNLTVVNHGSVSETFTVTARANDTIFGSQTVTVAPGGLLIVSFNWNPQFLPRGVYRLYGHASQVPEETDVSDNDLQDGLFTVRMAGDVSNDCIVDITDLALVGGAFGTTTGSPGFNKNADLNNDLVINILDLSTVGSRFGRRC